MRDTPDKAAALCWGNSKVRKLIDPLHLRRVLTGPYFKGLCRPGLSAMKVSASSSAVKRFISIAPSAENEPTRKG